MSSLSNKDQLKASFGDQFSQELKKYVLPLLLVSVLFLLLYVASTSIQKIFSGQSETLLTQEELFDIDKVWEAHIQFADSILKAMTPYGGFYPLTEGDSGYLDLSAAMSPLFYRMGDLDNNKIIEFQELKTLYNQWFERWDTLGKDTLNFEMISSGYSEMVNTFDLRARGYLRNGVAGLFGIYAPTVIGDFTFDQKKFPHVKIRHKGNGTIMNVEDRKKSIKIDLNDINASNHIAGVSKLNLHNLITDAGYMNDALAYEMFRLGGVPGPRTSYVKVYISTDSLDHEYYGLFLLVESVDNNFAQDRYGSKKGVIFKPVTPYLFEYMGDDWNAYIRTYDPKTPILLKEQNRIIEVCKFVTQSSDQEFEDGLSRYFDLDNLARYMAINTIICDLDGQLGPGQNTYLYLDPKTFKIHFIPWDHDHSFGQMRGTQEERERLTLERPWMFENHFLDRVDEVAAYKEKYYHYVNEFNNTLFKPERIHTRINDLAQIIRPAVSEESEEKLEKFDLTVGWGRNASNELKYDTFLNKEGAKPLRLFVEKRHRSVNNQLTNQESGLAISGGLLPKEVFGSMWMGALNTNEDSIVTRQEFNKFFAEFFYDYAGADSLLQYDELRQAINIRISPDGIFKPETHVAIPEPADKIYLP